MEATEVLQLALRDALKSEHSVIEDGFIREHVRQIAQTQHALTRFMLACCLAKAHNPGLDIRKPYTQIAGSDSYSGRGYDEEYITPLIFNNDLPCNPTTAFLTPALRNHNRVLTPNLDLEGRPRALYKTALELLSHVAEERVSAMLVLTEIIRQLLIVRNENRRRMASLLTNLDARHTEIPLSAERLVTLVEQHLRLPHSSRLPVLIVAAAYAVAGSALGERTLPLAMHNAADKQTGATGDIEVVLESEQLIAAYEMKSRRVTTSDIDVALQKLHHHRLEHYVFITTEAIDRDVQEFAALQYERTGGTEVVVLDCIGFLRHFLHFFHQKRNVFLESYQKLVLEEPESAVRQTLKEAWLALRLAAES
jgi:hypothetical protein